MPDLNRTGWTATASSFYDAATTPAMALDGINIYQGNATFWLSEQGFPHWIAIDMGSPRTFNYVKYVAGSVRFYPPVLWGQANPLVARIYTSTNGVDWTLRKEQVWPGIGMDIDWVVLDAPVTARYFKLEGSTAGYSPHGYDRMICAEIYAGLLALGETYKHYQKIRPMISEDLTPYIIGDPLNNGIIDSVWAGAGSAGVHSRLWRTGPLSYYPEVTFSNWMLPAGWESLGVESILIIAEGSHTNGAYHDFTLVDQRTSVQTIFDFLMQWSFEGPFSGRRQAPFYTSSGGWAAGMSAEVIAGMYSNMLLTGSISANAPDHDANAWHLDITDHYLLMTWYRTYYLPPLRPRVFYRKPFFPPR